jgi:chromosome segregation ATPase
MTMDNQELKDFIGLSMGQLTQEISRLSASVDRQNAMMREIDIKTTTRIAELQKDVEEIRRDVQETRQEMRELGDSQKFKWKTLSEERAAEKEKRESKDRIQAIVNNKVDGVERLLWFIATTTTATLLGAIVIWIINGGLKSVGIP